MSRDLPSLLRSLADAEDDVFTRLARVQALAGNATGFEMAAAASACRQSLDSYVHQLAAFVTFEPAYQELERPERIRFGDRLATAMYWRGRLPDLMRSVDPREWKAFELWQHDDSMVSR